MRELLSAIIGNKALRERLGSDILTDKLPHALIFEGPRGTGKHTLAKMCAAALMCENKHNESRSLPCLSCLSCRKVLENKSTDVTILGCEENKASIGVDTARFIREDVNVIPIDSEYKVYIIEDADKMTNQAQNALLLTLEEPPRYVRFFLLCENAGSMLETILSRAPVLRTELLSVDEIDKYICSVDRRAAQMKLADPNGYKELLITSDFGIGKALDYLDPRAFNPQKQLRAIAFDFISAAVKKNRPETIIPLLSKFSDKRDTLTEQLTVLSLAVRDLILLKKSDDAGLLFFYDRDLAIELSDQASIVFLYELQNSIQAAIKETGQNANVRICLLKMAINAKIL